MLLINTTKSIESNKIIIRTIAEDAVVKDETYDEIYIDHPRAIFTQCIKRSNQNVTGE